MKMNRHSKSRRERKHKIKGSIRFGSCNEIFLRYEAPDDLVDKDEENVKNKFFDNAMKHLISKGVDSLPLLLNKYIPIPDNAVEVITIEEKNGNPKESRKDFLSLKKGKIIEEGVKRLFYNSLLKHFRYSDLTKSTLPNNYFKITIDDNNKRQAFILKLSRQGKGLKPHENMALSYEVCLWKVFSFGAYGKSYMGASSRCRELGW